MYEYRCTITFYVRNICPQLHVPMLCFCSAALLLAVHPSMPCHRSAPSIHNDNPTSIHCAVSLLDHCHIVKMRRVSQGMLRISRLCLHAQRRAAHLPASTVNINNGNVCSPKKRNFATTVTDEPKTAPLGSFRLFASCLPGLEPILFHEILALGFEPDAAPAMPRSKRERQKSKGKIEVLSPAESHSGVGGVHFTVHSVESIMKCHLYLGTATHVLLRCSEAFKARGMEELRRKISKMPFWRQYINFCGKNTRRVNHTSSIPDISIRVSASKSRLYHTEGIAQRIRTGIYSALGLDSVDMSKNIESCSSGGRPTINIVVRVKNDYVQVSVDTSVSPLHKRGYRLQTAKSPLREDLAYSLLRASGWAKPNDCTIAQWTHLLDPFCGSGTIAIEGAAMMAGLAPGRLRPAPLNGSIFADETLWSRLISNAESNTSDVGMCIFGSDRDRGAIDASVANANRAGVSDFVKFETNAIKASPWLSSMPPENLLIATNPPFGIRSSKNKNVYPLYRTLVHCFQNLPTDSAALSILAHDIDLLRKCLAGQKRKEIMFSTKHGGLNVVAMHTHKV